jgi:hypothetical protein
MMNTKGFEREQLWSNVRYYRNIFPGGTEEDHGKTLRMAVLRVEI